MTSWNILGHPRIFLHFIFFSMFFYTRVEGVLKVVAGDSLRRQLSVIQRRSGDVIIYQLQSFLR